MVFGLGSYPARVVRVIDGDTVDLTVDVGFHLSLQHRFRLSGLNCPELHAKDPADRDAGQRALAFTDSWLQVTGEQWPFRVVTEKDPGNLGRWLARIYKSAGITIGFSAAPIDVEECLNDALLSTGHAVPFRR